MTFIANRNCSINSIVHKAAVFLLYDTGCRISELLRIKISNVDLRTKTILLEKTKSAKPRVVFYTVLSEKYLEKLININPQSTWLFWNIEKDRKFNRDSDMRYINRMIQKHLGLNKLHNHQYRKTITTDLSNSGANIKTIQHILGHATQKTTEIYIEIDQLKAKEDYYEIK